MGGGGGGGGEGGAEKLKGRVFEGIGNSLMRI